MSFRLQTVENKKDVCKVIVGKCSINFKLNELNYLLTIIATLEDQLSRYSIAQNDVIVYVSGAWGFDVYVQLRHETNTLVLYDVLFNEVNSIM
jgi:hypothetical protein